MKAAAAYGQVPSKPVRTLVFLGDSITDCSHLWDDDPRCLGQGYVREISDALSDDSCRLANLGQDGFTSADVLRLLQREGLPHSGGSGDCISLLIGVNDLSVCSYADPSWIPGQFDANIQGILSLIRRFHKGKLILMEPFLFPTPAEHLLWFPLLAQEHGILQAAARQYGGLYLPLQDVLVQAAALRGEQRITPDGIHLTREGSRIVAEEWLKA